MYWSATSPKRPEPGVEIGDLRLREVLGEPTNQPFGGNSEEFEGAFLGRASTHHLIGVAECIDQLRDLMVGVGHVGVGPHHDVTLGCFGADPSSGSGAPVAFGSDHPGARIGHGDLRGAVARTIVDDDQLPRVGRGVHHLGDAVDLGLEVPGLVVNR